MDMSPVRHLRIALLSSIIAGCYGGRCVCDPGPDVDWFAVDEGCDDEYEPGCDHEDQAACHYESDPDGCEIDTYDEEEGCTYEPSEPAAPTEEPAVVDATRERPVPDGPTQGSAPVATDAWQVQWPYVAIRTTGAPLRVDAIELARGRSSVFATEVIFSTPNVADAFLALGEPDAVEDGIVHLIDADLVVVAFPRDVRPRDRIEVWTHAEQPHPAQVEVWIGSSVSDIEDADDLAGAAWLLVGSADTGDGAILRFPVE